MIRIAFLLCAAPSGREAVPIHYTGRKKIVDAVAASLILENYLDYRRMKQE